VLREILVKREILVEDVLIADPDSKVTKENVEWMDYLELLYDLN
jgi:hypothetical protein